MIYAHSAPRCTRVHSPENSSPSETLSFCSKNAFRRNEATGGIIQDPVSLHMVEITHTPSTTLCRMRFRVSLIRSLAALILLVTPASIAPRPALAASPSAAPRWFVGNFIGNDATVENYLSVSGGVDRTQNFESLYLEKTISTDASLSLFVGYQRLEQQGEDAAINGFSNLGLGYKHFLLTLPAHEFLLTINPSLELPVGDRRVSETHTRAGGDVLFQKGFGDLPETFGWLRPAGIEGDAGFESKVTGARDDLLNADLELEYSLGYLDANVAANSVPRLMRNFTPHLDFDYAQYLSAHNNSSAPDLELTPGIAWMNETFEVNLGAQIALNHASSKTGAIAFVWLLGVSYDQLVPALGWNLFR